MRRTRLVVPFTLLFTLGLFVACAEDDEEAGPKTHTDAGKVTNGDATTGGGDSSLVDVNNLADSPAIDTGPGPKKDSGPGPVDSGGDAKKDAGGDAATDTGTDTGGNVDSGGQDASVDADDDAGLDRFAFVLLLVSLVFPRSARADVSVLVPDAHNLQYLSFWVAKGAGFFAAEGAPLAIVTPPSPALATSWMREHKAPVGLLSPPTYVELISTREPIVLAFNLLRNEPIALVVRKDVAAERKVDPTKPLREKLSVLKGLRIGVAPHPTVRLRQLLASEGLDADRDVTISVVPGRSQNEALRSSQVDALFAHTPFLEEAIVEDGAVLVVDGPRGESPALAVPQVHALVLERTFLDANPAIVAGMGRALVQANRLIHEQPARAVDAVLHEFPEMKRSHVETIVRLYTPAIPDDPAMTVEGIRARLPLLPTAKAPSLDGIDLASFVDPRLGRAALEASKPARSRTTLWVVASLLVAATILATVWRRLVVRRGRP